MRKRIVTAIFSLCLAASFVKADQLQDMYFTGENIKLTKQERDALNVAKDWKAGAAKNIKPVAGEDGSIKFLYGSQQTNIVCAVLQICDVALQMGEQVNGIHLGDNARWHVSPAITGSGVNEIVHLIIKPLDIGLETSLVVTTDRRTYHFKLRSHKKEYMPKVSFTYLEDTQAQWEAIALRKRVEKEVKTIPSTGEYLGNLDFKYTLSGDAPWKPVRVYNDGRKTIIQMPEIMKQTEAPTLLLVGGDGEENTIVNYRLQGDRYIVDSVFQTAILIAGVGDKQDRVEIGRGE